MEFSEFIDHFEVVKQIGSNQYMAKCPAHVDKEPSLSICDQTTDHKNKNILINCFAGCKTEKILESVGLEISDLYLNNTKENNKNSTFLNIENTIYKYKNEEGELLFEKVRTPDKNFFNRRYLNDSIIWGLSGGMYWKNPKRNEYTKTNKYNSNEYIYLNEQAPILYKLPELINAITEGKDIYIVEGEKDVETMIQRGFCATTGANGGGSWDVRYNHYFTGAKVIVIEDNDNTGKGYGLKIKKELLNFVWKIKTISISNRIKGDVTDYFADEHTNEEFNKVINFVDWEYPRWIENNRDKININSGILAQVIKKNLHFRIINSGDRGNYYIFKNGYYRETTENEIKYFISKYIPQEHQKPKIINDILSLMKNELSYSLDKFDMDNNIINFKNGLYDIKKKKLLRHTPEYLSLVQIKADYNPNYNNFGYWDNFINYLINNDEEIKLILQEFFGLAISNFSGAITKKALILFGVGDTGKSKYLEILEYLLGSESTINAPIQKLCDPFILGKLGNARLIYDGDLPSDKINDEALAVLKRITGNDKQSIQKKFKDITDVLYKGVVAYSCNNIPQLAGDLGEHVFNRLKIIPCTDKKIPEKEQERDLVSLFKADISYIILWAIEGLERLIKNNFIFTDSAASIEATKLYRHKVDSVKAFVDNLIETNNLLLSNNKQDKIKTTILYDIYESWVIENDYDSSVTKAIFADRLKNYYNVTKIKYNGIWYFPYLKYLGNK